MNQGLAYPSSDLEIAREYLRQQVAEEMQVFYAVFREDEPVEESSVAPAP